MARWKLRKLNWKSFLQLLRSIFWPTVLIAAFYTVNNFEDIFMDSFQSDETIPAQYNKLTQSTKRILLYYGTSTAFGWRPGTAEFEKCNYKNCFLSYDRRNVDSADVIVFYLKFTKYPWWRPPRQIWATLFYEPPTKTFVTRGHINWTISYTRNATIRDSYLNHFTGNFNKESLLTELNKKSKMVVWFVSNCRAKNYRMEYAKDLQKYIQVDIFGKCSGRNPCPGKNCLKSVVEQYLFYLSFENSNCRDYITEKFNNAIQSNAIPIVMGAHPDDYKALVPPHSYIHVDEFRSAKELADYLNYLAANKTAYFEYFQWKISNYQSTISPPPSLWCTVCRLAHQQSDQLTDWQRSATNVEIKKWWSSEKHCIVEDRWIYIN